jgi:hypothetical protein
MGPHFFTTNLTNFRVFQTNMRIRVAYSEQMRRKPAAIMTTTMVTTIIQVTRKFVLVSKHYIMADRKSGVNVPCRAVESVPELWCWSWKEF